MKMNHGILSELVLVFSLVVDFENLLEVVEKISVWIFSVVVYTTRDFHHVHCWSSSSSSDWSRMFAVYYDVLWTVQVNLNSMKLIHRYC